MKQLARNVLAIRRKVLVIKYHFGVRVTRNIAEEYFIDGDNLKHFWVEGIEKELKSLHGDFECFQVDDKNNITHNYQRHLCYKMFL